MKGIAIFLALFLSIPLFAQETDPSLNVPPPGEEGEPEEIDEIPVMVPAEEIPLQEFTLNIFDVTRNDEFRLIEELVKKFPGTKEFRLTKATRGLFVFNGKVEKDVAGLVERLRIHLAARFQIEAKMPDGVPAEITLIYIPPA